MMENLRMIIIDYNAIAIAGVVTQKINIDENVNYSTDKLISIGPSFGIHIFSSVKTYFLAPLNYLKSRKRIEHPKSFFSCYKAQLQRPKIGDYAIEKQQKNGIYFVGSLWKKETKTNTFRANFIKSCLTKNIAFEGGFAPRSKNDIRGYEELTMKSRDSIDTYLKKQKQSLLTFNTPAVLDCHGWKLAEFLSLGKAIISTPLTRKLPSELVDHNHLLITDGSQMDIEEKLDVLTSNNKIRTTLEKNAKAYFENELAPLKVIQKIKNLHRIKTNY